MPRTVRVYKACQGCKKAKKRCSDERPCARCVKAGRVCVDFDGREYDPHHEQNLQQERMARMGPPQAITTPSPSHRFLSNNGPQSVPTPLSGTSINREFGNLFLSPTSRGPSSAGTFPVPSSTPQIANATNQKIAQQSMSVSAGVPHQGKPQQSWNTPTPHSQGQQYMQSPMVINRNDINKWFQKGPMPQNHQHQQGSCDPRTSTSIAHHLPHTEQHQHCQMQQTEQHQQCVQEHRVQHQSNAHSHIHDEQEDCIDEDLFTPESSQWNSTSPDPDNQTQETMESVPLMTIDSTSVLLEEMSELRWKMLHNNPQPPCNYFTEFFYTNVPVAMIQFSPSTNYLKPTLVTCNEAFCKICGLEFKEMSQFEKVYMPMGCPSSFAIQSTSFLMNFICKQIIHGSREVRILNSFYREEFAVSDEVLHCRFIPLRNYTGRSAFFTHEGHQFGTNNTFGESDSNQDIGSSQIMNRVLAPLTQQICSHMAQMSRMR